MIHPESIYKMLYIAGILIDHIATSQFDAIKSQMSVDYLLLKNTKKNKSYVEIGYLLHVMRPQSIFPIFLIIFLNSDIDLLDITKLGKLFQIKDPRKCTELVP